MRKFYGKYRGKVVNNNDESGKGLIEVSVPSVLGPNNNSWAMPCVPYAGDGVGLFTIPPENANVWIEFEGGDPDSPIWTGCFWDEGEELPVDPYSVEKKILKTGIGSITLNDSSDEGGITIETNDGMKIEFNSSGIEITNGQGKIKIEGNQVSVNDGALEVT